MSLGTDAWLITLALKARIIQTCADPDRFVSGGLTLTTFLFFDFLVNEGR